MAIAAKCILEHVDLHPGASPFGQRLGDLHGDMARPEDEVFEADRAFSGANCAQHGGEDLGAILQCLHTIAVEQRRAEELPHSPLERAVAHTI
jgi:hypothetical protein